MAAQSDRLGAVRPRISIMTCVAIHFLKAMAEVDTCIVGWQGVGWLAW